MNTAPAARPGSPVEAIDTPALVVDVDAMERNLQAMAAFARGRGVRLRPHAKMHKSATIARLQIEAGAVGVCVQKTSEAEALAAAGIDDIYISNEVIDEAKLDCDLQAARAIDDVLVLIRKDRNSNAFPRDLGLHRLVLVGREVGEQAGGNVIEGPAIEDRFFHAEPQIWLAISERRRRFPLTWIWGGT
jgi:hypothetical protein